MELHWVDWLGLTDWMTDDCLLSFRPPLLHRNRISVHFSSCAAAADCFASGGEEQLEWNEWTTANNKKQAQKRKLLLSTSAKQLNSTISLHDLERNSFHSLSLCVDEVSVYLFLESDYCKLWFWNGIAGWQDYDNMNVIVTSRGRTDEGTTVSKQNTTRTDK